MKRLLALLLAAALAVSLNACGAAPEEPPEEDAPELPEAAALELDTTYQIPEYADFSLVSIATTSKVQASMGGAYYESDDGTPYVDVVLDVVNTGSAALDCQDLLVLTAASPEGIEYPGSLYCVEKENMTSISAAESIPPQAAVRFHAAAAVPVSVKELNLLLNVNGTLFSRGYQTGSKIKNTIELQPGQVVENKAYASMEFVGYEFTEDLLPSDTSHSYRHFQIENPESVYLALQYNVTNFQAVEKDIETFLNVQAVFGEKYQYDGFIIREDDDERSFSSYAGIAPLSTAKLFCLIEVPKAAAEQPFTVSTIFDKQEYVFSAQP